MKILKNKLFLGSICVIGAILLFQIYVVYSQNTHDTRSYVEVLSQEVHLNSQVLSQSERYILHPGDYIETRQAGRALIEWGDGSVTRLGENSELRIDEASVSTDRTQIRIRFELLSGRTWSNVVSFLGNDSSFTQKIEGLDAGVRGTIFDVDLDAGFLRVSEHVVELTNELGDSLLVSPEVPFDISQKTFITLEEFIRSFQDIAWTEYNRVSDNEYKRELLRNLESSIERNNPFLKIMEWFFPHYRVLYELDRSEGFESVERLIINLSENARSKTNDLVQSRYQDFNFLSPDDHELYTRKIRYQKALLLLSDDSVFQQSIIERAMLDLRSSIALRQSAEVESLTGLIDSYSNLTTNIEQQFIDTVIGGIGSEIGNEYLKTKSVLDRIFQIDISDIGVQNPGSILDSASSTIENFLEDNFGDTLRNFLR